MTQQSELYKERMRRGLRYEMDWGGEGEFARCMLSDERCNDDFDEEGGRSKEEGKKMWG